MANEIVMEPEYLNILDDVLKKVLRKIDEGKENIFEIVPFVPVKEKINPVFKAFDAYIYEASPEFFEPKTLVKTMTDIATKSNAHIACYDLKIFKPQGFTGTLTLYESTLYAHTYPEDGSVYYLEATCGSGTHPIKSFVPLLKESKSIFGNATYFKDGHDTVNREFVFAKSLEKCIEKNKDEFDTANYVYTGLETFYKDFEGKDTPYPLRYDFFYAKPEGMKGDVLRKISNRMHNNIWLKMKEKEKGVWVYNMEAGKYEMHKFENKVA